jgi:hypothetical protein
VAEKVKVYFCRIQNRMTDSVDSPPWKATAEHVSRLGGSIIPETEEEVRPPCWMGKVATILR